MPAQNNNSQTNQSGQNVGATAMEDTQNVSTATKQGDASGMDQPSLDGNVSTSKQANQQNYKTAGSGAMPSKAETDIDDPGSE